jgi:DNA-binding Lrp family transcriptional regulator
MENPKFKLDLKDRKILALLDENCRYSNSQIAKKVGLSKPAVEYRLRRFEKNKIIFEFYTALDITRLGYSQYKIYFKFQDATLEDEQRMIDYWKKERNSAWVGQIRGRWDLAVSILSHSNFGFGKVLNGFMNKFSKFILEKDVLLTEYSPIYSREYLPETKHRQFIYGKPVKRYKLDETDKRILRELSVNARVSIVELAEILKITRDIINYRIKKLTKDKIIIQYRCYPQLNNIGVNLYKLILRTKNLNEENEKQLREYIDAHQKATQYLKLIGSWDLEIEFETVNEDELYLILTDLRKRFSNIIRDFDILRITENYKLNYFPF